MKTSEKRSSTNSQVHTRGILKTAPRRAETATRTRPRNIDRSQALKATKEALAGTAGIFHLVSVSEYRKHRPLRSEHYQGYLMLCHVNTMHSTGWLVCAYAQNGLCPLDTALRPFNTKRGGTGALRDHISSHNRNEGNQDSNLPIKLHESDKRKLAESAVEAVVDGLLPLGFLYKKEGMLSFCRTLFELGQTVPFGTKVDIKNLLPSNNCVRAGVRRLASAERERYRNSDLSDVLKAGGGVTSDGLKQGVTGSKYYDFIVHYFRIEPAGGFRAPKFKLESRVIFLRELVGPESAAGIREMFNEALYSVVGIGLTDFMRNFSFVTDSAATMPCIIGASASTSKVPYSEKWLPCISHKLNTIMKHVINAEKGSGSRIYEDLCRVKVVVRVCKHGNWNNEVPDGFALIQEVETRFGSTHTVIERFLKSIHLIRPIANAKAPNDAMKAMDELLVEYDEQGIVHYPALEAINVCFKPIRHVQTLLERFKKPSMQHIMPALEMLKKQLKQLESGMVLASKIEVPHDLTSKLAGKALIELNQLEIHGMWVAGALMHPGMRNLSFVANQRERLRYRELGCAVIRSMLQSIANNADKEDLEIVICEEKMAEKRLTPVTLGESSFSLIHSMDTPNLLGSSNRDVLDEYLGRSIPDTVLNMVKDDDDFGVVEFWVGYGRQMFPKLSEVALRLYAVPVSSAASESDFSIVNRIVTAERSRLKEDIIEDLVYLRSFIKTK